MSNTERVERSRRAAEAFDEFIAPVLLEYRAAYINLILKLCREDPKNAAVASEKLAIAVNAVDRVEQDMRAAMSDGITAQQVIDHARRVADIPEHKRTLLQSLGARL